MVELGDSRQCGDCGEWRAYRYEGYTSAGRKRYVDETGRVWHGSNCPRCRSQYFKIKNMGGLFNEQFSQIPGKAISGA